MEVTETWVFEQETLIIKDGLAFEYIDKLRQIQPFMSYGDFLEIDFNLKAQIIKEIRNENESKNT